MSSFRFTPAIQSSIFCAVSFVGLSVLASLLCYYLAVYGIKLPISFGLIYLGFVLLYVYTLRTFSTRRNLIEIRILLGGVFFGHLVGAFAPMVFSRDFSRYMWEGKMLRSGISPYEFAPSDPLLSSFRDENWAEVALPHLSALYPPLAEYSFALFALTPLVWKLFLIICEILTCFVLTRALRIAKLPLGRIVAYAYLPLPFIEIALSGHIEGAFVLFFAIFLLLASRIDRNYLRSITYQVRKIELFMLSLSAAAGAMIKYPGFVSVGIFILSRIGQFGRNATLSLLVLVFIACFLIASPFLGPQSSMFAPLMEYLHTWQFNESIFHLLASAFNLDLHQPVPLLPLKYVLACVWLLLVAGLIAKRLHWMIVSTYALVLFLLFSPVVHPWYGLWFAPLLAFFPASSAIYLALTLPVAYYGLLAGDSVDIPVLVKLFEFAPCYALLVFEIARILKGAPHWRRGL